MLCELSNFPLYVNRFIWMKKKIPICNQLWSGYSFSFKPIIVWKSGYYGKDLKPGRWNCQTFYCLIRYEICVTPAIHIIYSQSNKLAAIFAAYVWARLTRLWIKRQIFIQNISLLRPAEGPRTRNARIKSKLGTIQASRSKLFGKFWIYCNCSVVWW